MQQQTWPDPVACAISQSQILKVARKEMTSSPKFTVTRKIKKEKETVLSKLKLQSFIKRKPVSTQKEI